MQASTPIWSRWVRGAGRSRVFHELSHGESFLAVLRERFDSPGLYLLDEPESALSFGACLGLVGLIADLGATGTAQVVVATHSPVVAAVPGARILQLDGDGYREMAWEDLDLVAHYRRFLDAPGRYLRHVID
jgi:predicted ATPase